MIKLTECLVYALIEFELVFLKNWLKGEWKNIKKKSRVQLFF